MKLLPIWELVEKRLRPKTQIFAQKDRGYGMRFEVTKQQKKER